MGDRAKNTGENSGNKKPQVKTKKKNPFLRILSRTFLYLLTSCIILLIALLIFIQTELFNKILLSYTLKEINDSWRVKESAMNVESVSGNILKGLTLNNGDVTVKGDTLLKFGVLEVKYDILALLRKEIIVKEITLSDPQINFTKVKGFDGSPVWNFDFLLTSAEVKKDTVPSEFKWDIIVENLKIQNGSLRIVENKPEGVPVRKVVMQKMRQFDFGSLEISDLNTELNGKYSPGYKYLNVKSLGFNTNSDFSLRKLAFETEINEKDSVTKVKNLEITTGRSNITAELLSINHFNPFSNIVYENFKNCDVKVNLSAQKFNFDDLKFFLPQLNFFDGIVSLDLAAEGKYSRLGINKLLLNTPNSKFNFKGRIDNLHEPSKLYFDVTAQDLVIDPVDTKQILPGLTIPDYTQVGKVHASFRYVGEPLNFSTNFNIRSDAGSAEGDLSLNLNTPGYSYKTQFEARSVNIGRIIKNNELEGIVNLKADINGNGFDFNTLSARVNYDIVDTKILGLNINKSSGILNVRGKNIDGELTYISDDMQSAVKGSINISDLSNPKYSLRGAVRNFDLSDFTKNSENKSNLDFTFDVNGQGISLENINGTYRFVFDDSYYSTYHIPSTPVDLRINNSKSSGSIDLITNLFEFRAKGKFNLGEVATVIANNIEVVTNELERKLKYDSLALTSNIENPKKSYSDFDFQYEFIVEDIKTLSEIFQIPGYKFSGQLSGRLQNSNSEFSSLSDIKVKYFSYLDSVILLKNMSGTASLKNDYQKTIPADESEFYALSSDIRLNIGEFVYSGLKFDSVFIGTRLADAVNYFQVSGWGDSSSAVFTSGKLQLGKGLVRLINDSLFARYREYEIHNDGPLTVAYNPHPEENTFTFEQFSIVNSSMKINMDGKLSLHGNSDLNFNAKNIKVAEIIEYLYPQKSPYEQTHVSPIRGNIRRLYVKYTGTLDDPVINFEMNSGLLRYQTVKIGRVDAFIDYKNSVLSSDVLVSNAQGNGKLRLTGDIPVANPFSGKDTAAYTSIANYPVDFKLAAKDFQINFFSKIIPNLTDIRGFLNGEISSKGTVSEPLLFGQMNISKGRFFLPLTGMYYRFNTNLKTDKSDLIVENFRILNEGDDRRHIDFNGRINFEGLGINDIDLTSSGDITIIDRSVDYNDLGLYGIIVAGSGSPPITLKGNLENLKLEGQFLIKNANITSISLQSSSYDIYSDNFVYKVISDSSRSEIKDSLIYVTPERYYETNPFSRSRYRIAAEYTSRKTNLNLNLNVKTLQPAFVSMSFGDVPKQEFNGEIKADIDVYTSTRHDVRLFGNIDIVGDSYYRFYRNFSVKESRIAFVGQPDNPELYFHAVYENKTGSTSDGNVQVVLDITGTAEKPEFSLKLFENGTEVSGSDAQSDAISYLLFGVPKSQLLPGQRNTLAKNIGTTTGTTYLSSILSEAVRTIAPFVVNTEVSYTEGNLAQGTDVRITSAFGDAIVKIGGRVFSDLSNTEVSIEYPLNKLFDINVSNNLILEISRAADFNSTVTGDVRTITTGVKILYIIRY